MSQYKNIKVKELEDGVVLIHLNRPKKLNSLAKQLTNELIAELHHLETQPQRYGCVIITGSHKVFCAGADISELQATNENSTNNVVEWSVLIPKIKIPIIAAVDGYCLGGGCELAMMCDIVYCTERAKFGQPEIKIGIIPGGGGTQRFAKFAGKSNAMEKILTGDQFSAKEAKEMGLVSKVFADHDQLMKSSMETALKISRGPRLAVRVAKNDIIESYNKSLNDGCDYEKNSFGELLSSYDKAEGMDAFFHRRAPVFEWKKKASKL